MVENALLEIYNISESNYFCSQEVLLILKKTAYLNITDRGVHSFIFSSEVGVVKVKI